MLNDAAITAAPAAVPKLNAIRRLGGAGVRAFRLMCEPPIGYVSTWTCMGWRPHRRRLAHELFNAQPPLRRPPEPNEKTLVRYVDTARA